MDTKGASLLVGYTSKYTLLLRDRSKFNLFIYKTVV